MAREYGLGHSAAELDRLSAQATLLDPFTFALLRDAGVRAGMRVLDAGCGNGDVTMLAAGMVGPSGSVVALDRAAAAVEGTRARTSALPNVEVVQGDLTEAAFDEPFDAVVGRLVLAFCPDPAAALRRLSAPVRPGGVVAFQEFQLFEHRSEPTSPLWDRSAELACEAMRRVGVDTGMGLKLYGAFRAAGLPAPRLRSDAAIGGGPDFTGYEVLADVVASALPVIERLGLATAAELDLETLAGRIRDEVAGGGGVVTLPPLVGAFAAVPTPDPRESDAPCQTATAGSATASAAARTTGS